MNTTALLLAVALASNPPSVTAPAPAERGFLSGLGIGLLAAGAGGVAVGVAGVLGGNDAQAKLDAYGSNPAAEELATVSALTERLSGNRAVAATGFLFGTLALAGGVICLVLDTPKLKVAFAPGPHGGVLVLSGRF